MNISKLMNERPLSPHLQVYRLPLTAWMSITHRATGVVLSVGMILLVVVLMEVAQGPESFARVHLLLQSAVGRMFLWGWIFSLLFHLCHGVRHLIWDAGYGFDRETLKRYAIYEISAALLLTLLLAFLALIQFR